MFQIRKRLSAARNIAAASSSVMGAGENSEAAVETGRKASVSFSIWPIITLLMPYGTIKPVPSLQGRPDSARQHLLELFSVPRHLSDGIFRKMTRSLACPLKDQKVTVER